jgi:hypothetical protein
LDSLDWSQTFAVLSISRPVLRDHLGFSTEQVTSLTDEDMQCIADMLQDNLLHAAGIDFAEEVRFVTSVFLAELNGGTNAEQTHCS